jgi:hypothetical protein
VIPPIPYQYTISFIGLIINNQENFSKYTILKQRISIISIDQMPTYLVIKKSTLYAGIKLLNSLPSSMTILKNDKAQIKVALRKYLHTHSFYSADEFCMCNNNL